MIAIDPNRTMLLMTNEHVRALNYSAHALEDLRTMRDSMDAQFLVSTQVLDNSIALLDQLMKFILPNCCSLIEPDQLTQTHVDTARLPVCSVRDTLDDR